MNQLLEKYKSKCPIVLTQEQKERIASCAHFLESCLSSGEETYYGINTGFGSLCEVRIEKQALEDLQHNLLRSHACGMGALVDTDLVALMLLLKIENISLGHSGMRLETVERLLAFYNAQAYPLVYEQGSLGASGDLAPLAHLALPLIGEGEMHYRGEISPAAEVLQDLGLSPLRLGPKEGLAMLNGTQFSLAYGLWALLQLEKLSDWADMLAALSIDAFLCLSSPYDARLHAIRPHPGQIASAAHIRKYLEGSEREALPNSVQDPYAFRCVPQVHGASRACFAHAREVFAREVASVTDNPNIFVDTEAILSGGNFHAQPLALVLDYMALAAAELGSISERRVYQLISGKRGLPPFLTKKSGLHSGFMIPQYTAASIASQNKQLCSPASIDSIVSCNGQEDHVSMAANAGTKLKRIVENIESLLGIELMVAAQAQYLRGGKSSPQLEKLLASYREKVPALEGDRILSGDMQKSAAFLRNYSPKDFSN